MPSFFQDIDAISKYLSKAFGCKVTANLYGTFSNSSAFGLHFDDHDVIALQLDGEKEWSIYAPTHIDPLPHEKSFYFTKPSGNPDQTFSLTRGGFLYVPSGYWHNAISKNSRSLHVSFVISRPRRLDVVKHILNSLQSDVFFRGAVSFNQTSDEIRTFQSKAIEMFSTEDISKWFEITKFRAENPDHTGAFKFAINEDL